MGRRELRENVFKLLFRIEFHEENDMQEQSDLYFDALEGISAEDKCYVYEKVFDIIKNLKKIDTAITEIAEGWKIGRMGKVDLSIIRLAYYEMHIDDNIPVGVAINEGVELAKKFGTEESPAFINGILAKLV